MIFQRLRILVIERSAQDTNLLVQELESGGYDLMVKRVATEQELRSALGDGQWDLIFSDCSLPRFPAPQALTVLKESGRDIPFIVVCDVLDQDVAKECVKAGARQFLAKNDLSNLVPVVEQRLAEAAIQKEHKQTQEALAERDSRLHLLFDNMLEGFAYHRMLFENNEPHDYIYLEVNRAFGELTGLRNVVGKRVSEVIPGIRESNPELFEIYGRVTLTGKPERFETYVAALGQWFSVSVYSPKKEHFVAMFSLITERKRIEQSLRKNEEDLKLAISIGKLGTWDWDFVSDRVAYSDQCAAIFGFSREALIGDEMFPIHPEDRGRIDMAVREALEKRIEYQATYRIVWPDATVHWVVERGRGFYDDSGKAIRVLGVVQDITEKKQAEEQLQKLFNAVENVPDTVVITDINGVLEYVNPAFEKLTGYTKAEAVGQTPALLKSGRHGMEFYQQLWQTVLAGREFRDEFINKKKNGELYYHEATISPIKDSNGKITHFVLTGRDITRRKETEELLMRHTAIIEATSDFVAMSDPHGKILYINRAGREMLGLRADDDPAKVKMAGSHPKWAADLVLNTGIPAAVRDGSWLGESAFLSRDGREIPTSQLILSHVDAQGNLAFLSTVARDISGRKRTEQSLLESEKRYRDLVDAALDVIASIDLEGVITSINPAIEAVAGWRPDEAIGKPFASLLHSESCAEATASFRRLVQEGVSESLVLRALTKTGQVVHVEASSTRQIQDGKVVGVMVIARDVTERVRHEEERRIAEIALRESEERYRIVAETISDAILAIDAESNILFANPALKSIFGYDPEEITSQPLTILIPERLRSQHHGSMRQYLQTGKKRIDWNSVELTGLHKTGREIPIELSFAESMSGEGRLFIGIVRDVSERKKAEEAVRKSEEKYRTLFQESKDAVFVSSPEGIFLDMNPAGLSLLGFSSLAELQQFNIGRDLYFSADAREKYKSILEERGYVQNYEQILKTRGGKQLVVLETSNAIRDESGKIVAYRGFLRDVTHLKQLQEQLLQSQKMETIGRLAGGVAHDFNNILMAVSGYCELMQMKMPPDDPLRMDVEEILKAQRQGASLTRQLLAFSRKQVLATRSFNLNEVVSNMERLLQRLIGEDIQLMIFTSQDVETVEADPGQIEQVIMNLAVNSRDAMPRGGQITLEVSHLELDEEYIGSHMNAKPGPYVVLSVTDTGHGMDKDTLSHVFEPFFTTKGKEKGTGLGLAMVFGIVAQSNGTISVYSEPGRGTTFKIYLPRIGTEALESVRSSRTVRLMKGGSETVLLVDDNDTIRLAMGELLKMHGYDVLMAGSGKEAIAASRSFAGTIHLLVTDVVMPEMSGQELARELSILRPGITVLYMSGYTDDAIFRHGILHSNSAFLQKPAPMTLLLQKIRELLDQTNKGGPQSA